MGKKAKVTMGYEAQGRVDAPYLFVLSHVPTEGMWSWFLQTLLDARIDVLDCRFVFQHNEAPKGAHGKFLKEQTREAWPRFSAEVRTSAPQVVVPLGSVPLLALTGVREHINKARGYVITSDFFRQTEHDEWLQVGTYVNASKATGAKKGDPKMKWVVKTDEPLLTSAFQGVVIPMFQLDHISAEGFAVTAAVNTDLDRAYRVVHGALKLIDDGFEYLDSTENVKLSGHVWGDVIAVDIETHGVDNEVIDRVSFSDGVMTASVPWDEHARDYTGFLFELPKRIFALHNSPFDIPRLIQAGVPISQWVLEHCVFDTMFAGVTIQPDLLKGLGAMTTIYLDTYPWKWRTLSEADPVRYSAKDSYVTALLALELIPTMKDLGTWDLFMGQGEHPGPGVMATLPMLTESTRLGLRINRPFAIAWTNRMQKHLLRLLKMWNRTFAGYNPFSTKDMRRLFYTEWGLPIQRNPEEGISVDELACMKLRTYTEDFRGHPSAADEGWQSDPRFSPRVFDLLVVLRDVNKQIGTYAQPVASSMDSRVYVQYLPSAKDDDSTTRSKAKGNTSTGRLVAYGIGQTKINIQNQPKFGRGMYLPDSPDMCLVQADYVRAEPHVMAYSAHDEAMIADLKSGDLYTALVNRIAAQRGQKITRKTGKNVFLAGQYLAGGPKKSDMILKQEHVYVSPEECNAIQAAIDSTYHDVAAFKQLLISMCNNQGFVRNPFGRVRTFYDRRAAAAVDFWPQSTVGDVMWCVMLEVHRAAQKYGGRFLIQVHDSIVVQVPMYHVTDMVADMRRIMCRVFDCVAPGFSIPVEFEVAGPGESWGQVKKYAA